MVDAVTVVGLIGMIVIALMIVAMLALTLLGMRSEHHGLNTESTSDSTAPGIE